MNILEQLKVLIDPSQALGAFIISVLASVFVGFFSGRKYEKKVNNTQTSLINMGTMNQKNKNKG